MCLHDIYIYIHRTSKHKTYVLRLRFILQAIRRNSGELPVKLLYICVYMYVYIYIYILWLLVYICIYIYIHVFW